LPFTLSHPAAIIPLHKLLGRRVSISAMVIGSMSPDFAYFLPGVSGLMTHSLRGIFSFCLPAGLLMYFIFHLLVKRPASLLLPGPVLARLRNTAFGAPGLPATSVWVLACSVMLGAATHIGWDAFTHRSSAIVSHFEIFRIVVFNSGGYILYLYKLLQHLSTAFGLLVLAWWIKSWLDATPAVAEAQLLEDAEQPGLEGRARAYIVGGIVAVSALCGGSAGIMRAGLPLERWLFHVVVAGLSGAALALLFYCLAWAAVGAGRRRNA